ncbi:MAG: peptidylprolyl isomerase [Clostridia bacterium]|nr:peptidylprolyl isomerase [Clostridia bacterium]
MKKIFTILACLMLITGCAPKNAVEPTENVQPTEAVTAESVTENSTEGIEETVQAVITMESGDTIKLELYPDVAPITVENFKTLANDGFYDGLTFHRIISGFMIQGGCPKGNGTGGPGHNIKGEFLANGVVNNLKHTRGVISMARSQAYDSAGSQFFIMHEDSPWLDGQYAAFGKVVEGIEVVDKIASVQTDMYDAPLEKVVIETIAIVE